MVEFYEPFRRERQLRQPGSETTSALCSLTVLDPQIAGQALERARTATQRRDALESLVRELTNPDRRADIVRQLLRARPQVIDGLIGDLRSPISRVRVAAADLLVEMASGSDPLAVSLRSRLEQLAQPSPSQTLEERRRLESIVQRVDHWRSELARRFGRVVVFRDVQGRTTAIYNPQGELYLSVRYTNNEANSPIAQARFNGQTVQSIERSAPRNAFERFTVRNQDGTRHTFHFDSAGWSSHTETTPAGTHEELLDANFRVIMRTFFDNGRVSAISRYNSDGSSAWTFYNRNGSHTIHVGSDGQQRGRGTYNFRPPR
jgi:hypothetical protein